MTAVVPELRQSMAAWLAQETVGIRAGDLAAVLDAAKAMAADLDTLADICGARPQSLARWRELTGEAD